MARGFYQRKLKGKALELQQRVVEQGELLTIQEWAKELYGHEDKVFSVRRCINQCKQYGFFLSPLTEHGKAGPLVLVTEKKEYAEHVNDRRQGNIGGQTRQMARMFLAEAEAIPSMINGLRSTIDALGYDYIEMKRLLMQKH